MNKTILAVIGLFVFIVGIIMLFNANHFIPSTDCGETIIGLSLTFVMLYEIVVGMSIIGGPITFLSNWSSKSRALSGTISLVVVVAFILLALFTFSASLGILGGSPLCTTCLPQSGYQCSGVVYNHYNGNMTVTIGQTTGMNWSAAEIYYVPQGTYSDGGVPVSTLGLNATNGYIVPNGLTNEQYVVVNLSVSGPVPPGTARAGEIWAAYTTTHIGQVYYAQIAEVTIRAV